MKKLNLPKFTLFSRKPKKLQATTVSRRTPSSESYYDEEPKTNLSSAFIVVLILHVVAVGGIYAFNSLRASRVGHNPRASTSSAPSIAAPLVPKTNAATPAPAAAAETSASAPVSKTSVYHVQNGDTLTKIALQHKVSVADLEEANGIKNSAVLRLDQVLTIPASKLPSKAAAPAVVQDSRKAAFLASKGDDAPAVSATANTAIRSYTVAKGDTPTSIAKKFGTTSTDLLKLNKIDDPKKMQIGQTLKVPAKKN